MECNVHDLKRNQFMLTGSLARKGYDWWWHSFTATNDATGERKPFFVEFFCCNPALGSDEAILGQDPQHKAHGDAPSYLMVKAGCWGKDARQLHRFFAWNDVEIGYGVPYHVLAGDCLACETDLIGHVQVTPEQAALPQMMCDSGDMYWDLHLQKDIAFNVGYGTSEPLRDTEAFEMYWHAEGIKTRVSGKVMLDGQSYTVDPDTSYGYSDKNWGSDFTSPWVWLASSDLVSNVTGKRLLNSAFDIGGGRPKAFGIALDRELLGFMYHEGHEYEFNFSKFWTGCHTEFLCGEKDDSIFWRVSQQTKDCRMDTYVTCEKPDMLLVNYESPDGAKRHNRLWNGGNGVGNIKLYDNSGKVPELIDDITAKSIGCEYGEYGSPDM